MQRRVFSKLTSKLKQENTHLSHMFWNWLLGASNGKEAFAHGNVGVFVEFCRDVTENDHIAPFVMCPL